MSEKRYAFYPGCSYKTAAGYKESLEFVVRRLGIELVELKDWNCCGATVTFSINEMEALAMAARVMALAESEGFDQLVTPCNACYSTLRKAQKLIEEENLAEQINSALQGQNCTYHGKVRVRHVMEVLANDLSEDELASAVSLPFHELPIAPYYGCQLTRPWGDLDHPDNPTIMDGLLRASGCQVVEFTAKTYCCGAAQMVANKEACLPLVKAIITDAKRKGAQAIATICPLCQFNLDSVQEGIGENMPAVFFTQLMGLAMGGSPRDVGIGKVLTPADAVLQAAKGVR